MQIDQPTFNQIMVKALEELRLNPDKDINTIADDCCRPYLSFFGSDINSYEILVFQVVMNLVNAGRE
jgi:hypothetical protein